MQYYIGSSTWGSPILWQRESSSDVWQGATISLDQVDANLCVNWSCYEFALWLRENCAAGDYVYIASGHASRGWRKVTQVEDWCCYYMGDLRMRDNANYLYILAHANSSKDAVSFASCVQNKSRLVWDLHGFLIGRNIQ